jgi:anti-sigma B factor antagonist
MLVDTSWISRPRNTRLEVRMEVTPYDFRIKAETDGERTVLLVSGDVALATSPILINRVEALFRQPIASIILDLGEVTFLDSSGIAALLRAQTLALEHGVPFALSSVSPEVRLVVKGAGLTDILGLES